ncbi:ABC transporter ATP-binding protein [Ruminococcus albus]|jgi:putative ABC transport system ATP-binding protein|uniref:Putative bacteriocin ABC transporter n=1 Tax=Ruminococcus albus 8 TaxID=246199 RepID=E9SBT8_RUMAL|nr:ABC transporter ATP-binding protein [Ruminococcus albus]EGC03228.1 putative bacteriocin ABC transporter [Ruminococcus albus 8]MBE6873574.1 ABC transporter ATP-binding protein [Ruminococcus albus]MCC3351773.1 ABC transporter ATP-binding protein [Ruminococcus albus 8]
MISLNNISVSYGKKDARTDALKNIDLTIDKGEFVTISGKSGCGKTTLLNVLGGIITPDSGSYLFQGEDVSKFSDNKISLFRNKCIGFVVQHFALINDRTVYDNITLPLKYRKKDSSVNGEKIDSVLDELGILEKKSKYPFQLSGGEKQRVAIARCIISNTEVILADEPTGALDEETGHKIMDILKKLNEKGKTIIMVTHDIELSKAGSRRIIMKDGKIVDIIDPT